VTHTVAVSIGIPFFNARRTLADAVRSVLVQTLTDWELLLVDDGSTDGSLQLAQRIRDPRVRLISDGVNKGLCARLNQIAALARAPYLARMDADDLMHPERLQRQLQFLQANRHVDLLDGAVYTIDEHNRPLGLRGNRPLNRNPAAVLRYGMLVHPTVMGRAQWFRENPYDPAYLRAEDRELWNRVCGHTEVARLPEPLLFYRESPCGNLGNYLKTCQTMRKILRIYGPAVVGPWRTKLLLAGWHLRALSYRVCTRLGLQGRLIGRRNRPLTTAEVETADAALRWVLQTPVPGLAPLEQTANADVPKRRGGCHERVER
jgi:glycosyltransferase involved in cell wall biosynthesis